MERQGHGGDTAQRHGCPSTLVSRRGGRRRGGPTKPELGHPKDDTPGCTAQARGIRDAWGEFERRGAVVLGVSPDSPEKHTKFREKYDLPFILLADEDHAVSEAYGVWVEKSFAGKKYMGVERSTFVIGSDGKPAKVMRRVKPDTHAGEVLAALPS